MQSKPEPGQQSLIKKPFKFKQFITRSIKERDYNQTSIGDDDDKAMATLQRFKLLATQCGVAQSPTRSPRTSPVIQLRRRRTTLRTILLGRRSSSALRSPPRPAGKARSSLKDLFVSSSSSSPPLELQIRGQMRNVATDQKRAAEESSIRVGSASGSGSPRPGWSGFRYRSLLLRRAWRPVLVTIPE